MLSPSLIVLIGAVTSTAAPRADSIHLGLGDCVPSRDLVHDLVGIEIGFDRLVDGKAATEVRVECHAPEISIALSPPARVKARRVSTKEIDKGSGARLIALNIVELLREADAGREAKKAPLKGLALRNTNTVIAARQPIEESKGVRTRISAAPALRFLAKEDRVVFGARASFAMDAERDAPFPWTFVFSAGVEQFETHFEQGSIRTRVGALTLAGGERIELADRLSIFGLIGASGGWAALSSDAKSVGGAWVGPMLGARMRYGQNAGVSLGVEAGLVTTEIVAEGEDGGAPHGQHGAWLSVDVAFDWSAGE